ncbi:MAG: imidazole glycerol phosphate synthase, glutamine amidotransferase subunit [Candidatus Levybacteria bacterium RIFCSPHIGHO2_12_FULL_38_12]|nr:MAG: imidazole glycerol phosphate synthase, glutamine amidotransferase subunit [Candidatus Levybacteria bacterium RIFCSPHIGHO2_01_FULL_38_12]OGH22098.1 MAG: imidazole glycerol phosphate synthase, glutamine amidotransferase subunit [Candidatus Levybacteria bacterium RIFCSPHIGHO2_02_FULL_37_18]OGH22946.1 MAG: imidazole glycerol phosphate synthase, glutamine amidotransferase subunit [Candidatus Levybacteria bacterium RIFCSPHIGHO2_12_FULL_38_12]OGH34116.1 MAG: imidazole glycerol phosphate synthas
MITIIDYGLGNLTSVKNALDKLGINNQISADLSILEKSDALILPGVGAAKAGMQNLKKKKIDQEIIAHVKKGKPFLGVCLGMQLLMSFSKEGNVECLNIIPGRVVILGMTQGEAWRRTPESKISDSGQKTQLSQAPLNGASQNVTDYDFKVPQIGWNNVEIQNSEFRIQNSLFKNIPDKSFFYFVHSYYCEPEDKSVIAGITEYGIEFCSVLQKENVWGAQFHPEKSSDAGLQMLKNFSKICT